MMKIVFPSDPDPTVHHKVLFQQSEQDWNCHCGYCNTTWVGVVKHTGMDDEGEQAQVNHFLRDHQMTYCTRRPRLPR